MKKYLPITLLIILISGCNFSQKTENFVKEQLKWSTSQMEKTYQQEKSTFDLLAEQAVSISKDSITTERIVNFHSKTCDALEFIDSVKKGMDKLNEITNNTESTKLIKETFINKGLADTLFNICDQVFSAAEKIDYSGKKKTEIKNSRDNLLGNSDQKKQTYFGMNSPMGVSLLLFGFQTELLNVATSVLEEHTY